MYFSGMGADEAGKSTRRHVKRVRLLCAGELRKPKLREYSAKL
jgi:hypothetical protein